METTGTHVSSPRWMWSAVDSCFLAPDAKLHYPWKYPLERLNALEQDRADLIAALRLADKMLDNGAGSYEYTGPIEWEETIKALLARLGG